MSWVEDWRFNSDLRKLQKAMARVTDGYHVELDKASDWDHEQMIAGDMWNDLETIRDEVRSRQHGYITKQADRLLLPLPPFDAESGDWVRSDSDHAWTLSPEVLARLGREVRQERRERLELVFLWPSSVLGLVGGIAGIASAISQFMG